MAKTYKPKKKKVNAVQWTGANEEEIRGFIGKGASTKRGRSLIIKTPSSAILLNDKDWLVEDGDSMTAMSDKVFTDKYQEAEEK